MAAGLLPAGEVDTRPIQAVNASDVRGFRGVHFFAGLGGWPCAARLAGWPDDRPIWTGSCPCQPFSVAGQGLGEADSRHLWPDLLRLIRAGRPAVVMGEQVAGAAGYGWFDGVAADLGSEGYACRAVDIPAAAVNAPHIRQRLYWVGHTDDAERRQDLCGRLDELNGAAAGRPQGPGQPGASGQGAWEDWEAIVGPDGKRRRAKPGVRLLVDGIPDRIPKLRALANALVAPLAVEVIRAYMEAYAEY